jgi:glyoxylase-like metal-dependent hydrolase (beta-lactamase superfamily II)
MLKTALLSASLALIASAQDARTVIVNATAILGPNLTSVTYSGTAGDVNFLQTQDINGPWPIRPITNYTRAIDLSQPASRATGTTNNPGLFGGPGIPGNFNQNITPAQAAWAQQLEIYITPWGFLKGAVANNATLKSQRVSGKNYNVVTWMTPQKSPSGLSYTVNGYINPRTNLVERVETWLDNPVLGDMHVDAAYTDYKDMGGAKIPGRIVQKRGGWPFFEVTVTSGSADPANLTALMTPPAPAGGKGGAPKGGDGKGKGDGKAAAKGGGLPPPPSGPPSEKLAEGVYRIAGGYVSMAIEFKDYILVLEGGQPEARGVAVIAEAKRLIPNKPIRYVFNSHPHSDHSGGLSPFVAEGATIITHNNNKKFLEDAFGTPRTLLGDTLAKNSKKPKVEGVGDKRVLKDDTRSVEFHYVKNLGHSNGMLVAYLPKERILFQADFTINPGQPANGFVVTLADNVERLKLDFDRYIPVHAPNPDVPWTKADLMKAVEAARAAPAAKQ